MRPIDADALMRMICGNECGCAPEECECIEENEYDPCTCNYRGYIEDMPTIEAVMVRHGQWIDARDLCGSFVCPVCEYQSVAQYNFCPQCGAKMDGGVT